MFGATIGHKTSLPSLVDLIIHDQALVDLLEVLVVLLEKLDEVSYVLRARRLPDRMHAQLHAANVDRPQPNLAAQRTNRAPAWHVILDFELLQGHAGLLGDATKEEGGRCGAGVPNLPT